MKAARWVYLCVLAVALSAAAATKDAKKGPVAQGHAKPSSYAPQPRAPNRAYGAPIQKPILKHKRPKHRASKPALK